MKKGLIIPLLLLCYAQAQSQDPPKSVVAIMPFSSIVARDVAKASQVQETVIEVLQARTDIRFVDRSKDTLVLKELYNQTRLESVSADGLANQGKLLGANDIIAGTLTSVSTERKTVRSTLTLSGPATKIKYSASISFSVQIMDVETGQFKDQKVINVNTDSEDKLGGLLSNKGGDVFLADSPAEAIVNALKKCKPAILKWINEVYPPDIKIIKVDETSKSGAPEVVLVTGLSEAIKKGTTIIVNEVEMMDAGGGKMLKRIKKIAELKVQSMEGEITVCKVSDGEKALGEKMAASAKLTFEIK